MRRSAVLFIAVLALAACQGKDEAPAAAPAGGRIITLPDGTTATLNNPATLKALGVDEARITQEEERLITVEHCYELPQGGDLVGGLAPGHKLLAVDARFSLRERPVDPDTVTLKDSDGLRPVGLLKGRINLHPDTGTAMGPQEPLPPDARQFREYLLFEVSQTFIGGLLYARGKPMGRVIPGKVLSLALSAASVVKPTASVEPVPTVPESMKSNTINVEALKREMQQRKTEKP